MNVLYINNVIKKPSTALKELVYARMAKILQGVIGTHTNITSYTQSTDFCHSFYSFISMT
jgi:hypothetical protein